MRITIDLDDVIFNTRPIFERVFTENGQYFTNNLYTNWDLSKCFDTVLVKKLYGLFKDDVLYSMPILDIKIPAVLNNLMQQPGLEVLFVTERLLKQPLKTFQQLQNAGIKCSLEQVYDKDGKKSDILHEIKTDLHFDDSPNVVSECIQKHVPIVMISNNATLYNYHLRNQVEHYETLLHALVQKGIYTK